MNFNIAAALLLATASSVQAGQSGLRQLQELNNPLAEQLGFKEELETCIGATCGMWGDPHMITCDGLVYDCQGLGIFTLMKNHAYNVQANFVEVGTVERAKVKDWGFTEGASVTNDIMVDFLLNDDSPVFQFGFGDLSNYKSTYPSEEGCIEDKYFKPVNMPGTKKTKVHNIEQCRDRCDNTPGCTNFVFWADGSCHVNDDNVSMHAKKPNWSRSVAGGMDSICGVPNSNTMQLKEQEERMKHGSIGKNCPLLMWVDGEMIDLSDIYKNGFLHGKKGDAVTVEMVHAKSVFITNKMPNGDDTVIELKAMGKGPGEMWSCHWEFFICLPASDQDQFKETSVGLLGSPDQDTTNDWMDQEGNLIDIVRVGVERHKASIDYCYDNWCVSQEDSLMSHHGDTTYEDAKCEHEDFHEFDINSPICVMSADKIKEACKDVPFVMVYGCEVDCCFGGCDEIPEVEEDLKKLQKETPDIIFDPIFNDCGDELLGTPDQVCPTTEGGIIKLLRTTGSTPLPEGVDIFYGIVQDPDPDDNGATAVRFKVSNPFDSAADVFVRHDKFVETVFTASTCPGFSLTASGCDDGEEIEVACKEFPGKEPFALVNVYFASTGISGEAEIDKCCEADDYDSSTTGVVEYTFQIECTCPGSSSTQ